MEMENSWLLQEILRYMNDDHNTDTYIHPMCRLYSRCVVLTHLILTAVLRGVVTPPFLLMGKPRHAALRNRVTGLWSQAVGSGRLRWAWELGPVLSWAGVSWAGGGARTLKPAPSLCSPKEMRWVCPKPPAWAGPSEKLPQTLVTPCQALPAPRGSGDLLLGLQAGRAEALSPLGRATRGDPAWQGRPRDGTRSRIGGAWAGVWL